MLLLGEDLKKEIKQLEKVVFNTFIKEGKPPIYEPDQVYSFCKTANAGNVFNFILSSISSDRHSKDRKELNKKRTVVVLYQFCFSLSQRCDSLQKNNGIFFKFCRLTDEGINNQRVLGTAVGSRSVKCEIFNSAKNS